MFKTKEKNMARPSENSGVVNLIEWELQFQEISHLQGYSC